MVFLPDLTSAPVRVQILGPLRIWRAGTEVDAGPHQQRSLLAALVARPGQPISMTNLIELIWGDEAPSSAVNVIHKYIGALRRLFEPGLPPRAPSAYLRRHANGYQFLAEADSLDLMLFRRLATEAARSSNSGRLDEALDGYLQALQQVQGSTGAALAGTPAAKAVFGNVDIEVTNVTLTAADVAIRLSCPSMLLAPLRRAAALDPLNEQVQSSLMRTLAAADLRTEALEAYRSIERRLAEELGIDPGPAVQETYRLILKQTVLGPHDSSSPVPMIPPGQLPPDPPFLTGHEQKLAEFDRLVARLQGGTATSPAVIAIDGPPGSGTSALGVRFARRVANRYVDGQLYIDMHGNHASRESISMQEALLVVLRGLGVHPPDVPETLDARVGMYRSLTAGKQILLLLDNVRNADQVRPLIPNSDRSFVLAISEQPLLEMAIREGALLLHLGVLRPDLARWANERHFSGRPEGPRVSDDARLRASSARNRTLAFG